MPKIVLLADFSEEYFKKILLGIAQYSKEHGPWIFCRMPYYYRDTLGLEGILEWAKNWGATGMVAQLENTDDTPLLAQAGFPIVVTDFKERFHNAPNITGSYMKTGAMGAEYFMRKGFKNFAFYGYSNFVWSRERGEGFIQALRKAGFNASFFEGKAEQAQAMWYYQPSELSRWLAELPKPVAVMACDDNCGQHVTEACKLMGIKIPEEVAVLGVDNDELICNLSDPPLSSIVLDAETGGYMAAQLLDKMMKGQAAQSDVVVEAIKIETRLSTDIFASTDTEIAKALKFIHLNFSKPIAVNDVLEHVALSRRAFEVRFRKTTGKSVYRYILDHRMEHLAQQLVETNRPIADIALDLGISELNNVSRLFKQAKNCSPNDYRKANQR